MASEVFMDVGCSPINTHLIRYQEWLVTFLFVEWLCISRLAVLACDLIGFMTWEEKKNGEWNWNVYLLSCVVNNNK